MKDEFFYDRPRVKLERVRTYRRPEPVWAIVCCWFIFGMIAGAALVGYAAAKEIDKIREGKPNVEQR